MTPTETIPLNLMNLAQERFGAKVLYATDDFFAEKENLLKPGRGIFIADKYTDRGKWMDGWESRRKRLPGHDFAIVRLSHRGQVAVVDIDTNFFLGNHPPFASLEGWDGQEDPGEEAEWQEILGQVALKPGSQNIFNVKSERPFSHLRLHIYPDGGVARFKVYGQVRVDWLAKKPGDKEDLIAMANGGSVVALNDAFFSPGHNLLAPGRGIHMGDGWETRRRRVPGNDWIVLALACPGTIEEVVIDTCHFKGNYPDRASLEAVAPGSRGVGAGGEANWQTLLPEAKLQADHIQTFTTEIQPLGAVSQVRLSIYPDGGISRLRLFGRFDLKKTLNQLDPQAAREKLLSCCRCQVWAEKLTALRPFQNSAALVATARKIWQSMGEAEYLEAFAGHPMIGDRQALAAKWQKQEAGEQGSVNQASDEVIDALMAGNKAYLAKFGFIFIICATGKSATEMLAVLEADLKSERKAVIQRAARAQEDIMVLRLEKLLR